jgi:hypothetical protein
MKIRINGIEIDVSAFRTEFTSGGRGGGKSFGRSFMDEFHAAKRDKPFMPKHRQPTLDDIDPDTCARQPYDIEATATEVKS